MYISRNWPSRIISTQQGKACKLVCRFCRRFQPPYTIPKNRIGLFSNKPPPCPHRISSLWIDCEWRTNTRCRGTLPRFQEPLQLEYGWAGRYYEVRFNRRTYTNREARNLNEIWRFIDVRHPLRASSLWGESTPAFLSIILSQGFNGSFFGSSMSMVVLCD